ncbi:MAG: ABC transporter substrate-binding protein [Lachnospiraceae bacterium]|nr:ABC transporter substrate-binding protein [Lachnospiraceae bacterium]
MKRIVSLLAALLLAAAVFTGCGKKTPAEAVPVRLGGLKGPTSMGMVKLLDDAEQKKTENEYEYTLAVAADELTPKLLKGELDIAAVPANLASVLYHNSDGAIRVIAVNTLGVVCLVEKGGETVKTVADLKGQTVYATGKGTTPGYALSYLLTQSGLDPEKDVTIEWKSEPTEVVAQMAALDHAVAMLPQPFVTVAKNQLSDLRVAVDLTEAWDALDNGSRLVTATLIVRSDFAEEHSEEVKTFLKEYAASADYVNENPKEASLLVEKFGIVKAAIAEKAIPECNIVCLTGNEMKTAVSGYLSVLFGQEPKSVGGKLPDDDFYLLFE